MASTAYVKFCPKPECGRKPIKRDDGRWECRACGWLSRPLDGPTNAYASWHPRIQQIIAVLESLTTETLDRQNCAKVFGIGRSAAVDTMRRFGAEQLGKSLVIQRVLLVERLKMLRDSPELVWKSSSSRRVADAIAEAQLLHGARKLVAPRPKERVFDEIPGVVMRPGQLTVDYTDSKDLISKLFGFANAVLREPDRFLETTDIPTA